MKVISLGLVGLSVMLLSCANTDSDHPVKEAADSLSHVEKASPNMVNKNYVESQGVVVIEAENFSSQVLADTRRWLVFKEGDEVNAKGVFADPDIPHTQGASGNSYIEILPDNRTNHDETLITGENFSPEPGVMGVLSYPVYFTQPGRYYIWGRAFSTGPEDNGFHFGVDGVWQDSSQRLQLCGGKHQWTWSSQQRRSNNHCGTPHTLWLDVAKAGQHTLMVSMREDGAELDKIILTLDDSYTPEGTGPAETLDIPTKLVEKDTYLDVENYTYLLHSNKYFDYENGKLKSFYLDKARGVLAVNAGNPAMRNKFISATYKVKHNWTGRKFNLQLVTLTELDGESEYKVLLNGKVLAEVKNPETNVDYQEALFDIGLVELSKGDKIVIQSNAVTNGKIPEGDITAFSRGRWRGLVLQPVE